MNGKQTMSSFKVLPIVFANSFLLTQSVHRRFKLLSLTQYISNRNVSAAVLTCVLFASILSIGTGIPSVAYWASKVAD
jgi:hypothetical protein